jgi:hypothetical protein
MNLPSTPIGRFRKKFLQKLLASQFGPYNTKEVEINGALCSSLFQKGDG